MSPADGRQHYSYTLYADPATAQSFDARRFGGPIGELVAEGQAHVLTEFLAPCRHGRILDVGTGTGRAALLLASGGAEVTGVDASEEMLAVARQRAAAASVAATFATGDAHHLDFADRSFDAVVCLRVLMHTPGWRQVIGELCRVAGRLVVLDYPSASSAAAVQALGRRAVHALGGRTEPYRVFTHGQIVRELTARGFRIARVHRQFVLPIAVHKAIGSRRATEATEGLLRSLGLLRLFGSPVTLVAERCKS